MQEEKLYIIKLNDGAFKLGIFSDILKDQSQYSKFILRFYFQGLNQNQVGLQLNFNRLLISFTHAVFHIF